MRTRHILIGIIAVLCIAGAAILGAPRASALTTVPLKHVYNGHLLDSSGNAISSAVTVRFSFWTSDDYASGDVSGTGAINTAASTYADWYEVHTVTPNSDGYFTVNLGSVTALPAIDQVALSTLLDLFIQVEVKSSGAADTAYELLDIKPSDSAVDRSPVLTVPFAQNADFIDQREPGTGSGDLLILGPGGDVNVEQMGSGTTYNSFTIDTDNDAPTNITLQFGDTLAEYLTFDIADDRFEFSNDVFIEGDLTVEGDINGVGSEGFKPLFASSGGGLNVSVNSGAYRLNGTIVNYTGGTVTVPDSATSTVFFTSTGIIVAGGDFPVDKSFIPVATVTAAGGGVTTVVDERVLQSDNREQTMQAVYHPTYENAAYQGDATENVGQLKVDHDDTNKRNYYRWDSTKNSLNDYDVVLRVRLSADFVRWSGSAPIRVFYRSTSSSTSDNQLDISVFDTNGSPVTLTGSPSDLASISWASTDIGFSGTPTWTPGSDFVIKFKLHSKSQYQMQLGETQLEYVTLLKE